MLWQCKSADAFWQMSQVCMSRALYHLHMTRQTDKYQALPDEHYSESGELTEDCKTGMQKKEFAAVCECLDGTHRTEACE